MIPYVVTTPLRSRCSGFHPRRPTERRCPRRRHKRGCCMKQMHNQCSRQIHLPRCKWLEARRGNLQKSDSRSEGRNHCPSTGCPTQLKFHLRLHRRLVRDRCSRCQCNMHRSWVAHRGRRHKPLENLGSPLLKMCSRWQSPWCKIRQRSSRRLRPGWKSRVRWFEFADLQEILA